MVNQTYLPNKTVTLNEGNLNIANSPVSLSPKSISIKDNYSAHKTINLTNTLPVTEKKEEKQKAVVDIPDTKPKALKNDVSVKKNYPIHKSVDFTAEIPTPIKEDKPKEEFNTLKQPSLPSARENVNLNYSSHKTVNITEEKYAEKKVEKPLEDKVSPVNKQTPPSSNIDPKDNYRSNKTINLADEISVPKQETKYTEPLNYSDTKSTIIKDEKIIAQSSITGPGSPKKVKEEEAYPERKTVSVSIEKIPAADAVSDKQPEIGKPQVITKQEDHKEIYAPLKTVSITGKEAVPAADKKDVEEKPIISTSTKSDHTTTPKQIVTAQADYPDNKSFSLAKEEGKPLIKQDVSVPVKKEESKRQPGLESDKVAIVKSKKPVLWMILSSTLLIATTSAGWFLYKQQGEISILKQNKEELTDSIMKLQLDRIHFGDIIVRGGKVDAKNNISVVEAASDAESIRVCFSIGSNSFANSGKKMIYIRLIDPNNHVLVKAKENNFEYKQAQIPFSLKEVVDYKNEEMMLCSDYKLEEKLQSGRYKAEIYTDGILDGTGTFELK